MTIEQRIIGRKAILVVFEQLYGITTWGGVRIFVRKHGAPLHQACNNKPYFIVSELIDFDPKSKDMLFKL